MLRKDKFEWEEDDNSVDDELPEVKIEGSSTQVSSSGKGVKAKGKAKGKGKGKMKQSCPDRDVVCVEDEPCNSLQVKVVDDWP